VYIVELQSLKTRGRETHCLEVYFHVQMWIVPNNLGTQDEDLTSDNVLQDYYCCFVVLDIGYYLEYKPVRDSLCSVSDIGFVPVCCYVR
jgi:hypothetical protein